MKQISFSEYVNSKQKLREALKKTPQRVLNYDVRRHCRLMVQNSEGKQYLALGPKSEIHVIWLYENKRKPLPLRIYFNGVRSIDEDSRFYTTWSGDKLSRWLDKNTAVK